MAGAFLLVLSGLGVVGLRVQQVHLAYQLDALRAEREQAQVLIRQLEVQVATLRSPARVAVRARQLGLTAPGPQQIVMAREFVTGTTGMAAAERNRVASIGPSALAGPGPRTSLTP
jgi:cell division protein FtsL